MILNKASTNYDPYKREPTTADIYEDQRPSQTYPEQLVSLRLVANATADAEAIRPPIFNIGRTPPRFGYRTEELGILDILAVDDVYSSPLGDWSGNAGQGYQGTSFPQNPSLP
jgi:hypothetical protein